MNEQRPAPALLGEALLETIRQAVREEIAAAISSNGKGDPVPTLLTVEELAEALKVKKSWVYDLTRRKKNPIPHIRAGRYPRFHLSEVLAWLESERRNRRA